MELQDFTEKEQEQIKQGLSEAVISDKEAGKKILALVPEEWIKRIPFFVRGISGIICSSETGRGASGEGERRAPKDYYGYL